MSSLLVSPTVEELYAAITSANSSTPRPTGAPSLLKKIKSEHPDWGLGVQRLKKVLVELEDEKHANNGSSTWSAPNASQHTPAPDAKSGRGGYEEGSVNDALEHQLEYQEKSTRYYRIRGRGEYDYGVTFNCDIGIFFNITQTRAIEDPVQRPFALYKMYDHLQYAAEKAGVPKEDLRRQLRDEFGCDPLIAVPPTPRTPAEVAIAARKEEMARQEYKTRSLEMKRAMLQLPDAKRYIRVDNQGEPIWDESVNGRYVVLVTKLKKGSGLDELETW